MSVHINQLKDCNISVNIVQRSSATMDRQDSSSRTLRDVSGQLEEGDPEEFFQIMEEIQNILKRKERKLEQPEEPEYFWDVLWNLKNDKIKRWACTGK